MSYELIGLPRSWFLGASPQNLEALSRIINKSYDKCRLRFGVILTPRIKDSAKFLENFQIDDKKSFVMFLFLGPQSVFEDINLKLRDFSSTDINESFDMDIPKEFVEKFQYSDKDISVRIVGDDFVIDEQVSNRVLATIGFKGYHSDGPVKESVREIELTSFTSFLRGTGPKLFNIVIDKIMKNKSTGVDEQLKLDRNKHSEICIHSTVIREHDLVSYYINKCGFHQGRDDIEIEIDEEGLLKGEELEDDTRASQDFHIAFLYRTIELH
ncbi:sporulation protein Rmd6p [[Candida] anglica]|uniref:Sporulation protein Rmd6p n=1 Tax=[Candida] anglica TaxID=148631 RepID=A0ABP0EI35_9ASCO